MNWLRELRIKHGYKTQKDLADVLFVNQTAVSQWERGATVPSSQMLVKLSELYGVTIDYILGRTDQKETPVPENGDGLSEEQREIVKLYETASPTLRAAALAVLKSSEGQGKAPGASSTDE